MTSSNHVEQSQLTGPFQTIMSSEEAQCQRGNSTTSIATKERVGEDEHQYGLKRNAESLIPWKLDRHLLLIILFIIGVLTGSFLFNWPPAQALYLRSGAYSWLCETNSTYSGIARSNLDLNSISDAELFALACDEQVQAVNTLMPIGVASMFVFAFVGGAAVDYLGPKLSALMGLLFQILGWLILSFCGEKFSAYPIANMLMGFGNDPMYIALLDCSNLFPGNRGVVIAILSASRSLSFALPSLFNLLITSFSKSLTFTTIGLSYVGVLVLCFIIVFLVFPRQCFAHSIESSQLVQQSLKTVEDGFSFSLWGKSNPQQFDSCSRASLTTRCGPTDSSFLSNATTAGSAFSISSNFRPSRIVPSRHIQNGVPGKCLNDDDNLSGMSFVSITPNSTKPVPFHHPSTSTTTISTPSDPLTFSPRSVASAVNQQSFESILNSGLYLPLLPIAATSIVTGTFFANSSRDQLGSALPIFVILNPLSSVSGFIIGLLNDKYGPLLVMVIINVTTLLQFTSLLFEDVSIISPYFTVFFSFLVGSFFLTQFYCYIALTFPGRNFGTLSGFVIMSSGLFSLVVTPMCDFSSFPSNYKPMNGLCLGLTATNIIFLYVLYRNQGRLITLPENLKNSVDHSDITHHNATADATQNC